MAGFGAGLGAFGSGALQGADRAAEIRQRMMQIQQMQMALDQAKKQTAAQALMFQAMSNPSQQGSQPAPTTAGSPFAQGPAPGPLTQAPPQGQAPPLSPAMPPQPQRSPFAGGIAMPQPNPMRMPQGPQAPMPAAGQSPQSSSGPAMVDPRNPIQSLVALLNSGRLDPQNTIAMLAQRIKQANPNADPETQAMALAAAVDMMKGVEPAAKAQMDAIVSATVRPFTAMQSAGAREYAADESLEGRKYAADTAAETARMRIADIDSRFERAQSGIQSRFDTRQGNEAQYRAQSDRLKALMQERIAAGQELAAAQKNNDDEATKKALAKLDAVDNKLQILERSLGAGQPARSPEAQSQQSAPDPSWPSAKDQKDGAKLKDVAGDVVAVAKNGQWVPVKGVP